MTRELGLEMNPNKINLAWLSRQGVHKGKSLEVIKQIADVAQKENAIKLTLEQVDNEIQTTEIHAVQYKDTGTYILRGIDDDLAVFEECNTKVASITQNVFARVFKDKVERLSKELGFMIEFFTTWKNLQKYWAYLMPIFEQGDISNQMSTEYQSFKSIDSIYRHELSGVNGTEKKTYQNFAHKEGLAIQATQLTKQFDFLLKSLAKYLEGKREHFPRLYFLSNEEIIDIVGQMDNIEQIERSLFKMFDGVNTVTVAPSETSL